MAGLRKKRVIWCDKAEDCVIEIWGNKLNQLRSVRKTGHIYKQMAVEMQEYGFHFSGYEIKVKIHNFTNKYKLEKTRTGPSAWKHYAAVHQILGRYKSFKTRSLAADSILEDEISDESDAAASIPSSPTSRSKILSSTLSGSRNERSSRKKEHRLQTKIFQSMNKSLKELVKGQKELKELEERKVSLLERFVLDFSEIKDTMFSYLNESN